VALASTDRNTCTNGLDALGARTSSSARARSSAA
jgi:hypothetical protein